MHPSPLHLLVQSSARCQCKARRTKHPYIARSFSQFTLTQVCHLGAQRTTQEKITTSWGAAEIFVPNYSDFRTLGRVFGQIGSTWAPFTYWQDRLGSEQEARSARVSLVISRCPQENAIHLNFLLVKWCWPEGKGLLHPKTSLSSSLPPSGCFCRVSM